MLYRSTIGAREETKSDQYIPKFTAQLSVAIPETPKAPTFEDFKNELKAYAGERFKAHGKEFDTAKSNQPWGDIRLDFNFRCKHQFGYYGYDISKHNTVLELEASSYKSALTADGFVSSFRTRRAKIDLFKPVADIKAKIGAFIDKLPKLQELIDQASAIEAKRQTEREVAEDKKAAVMNEVAKITGYNHSYGTFNGLHQSPYSSLKATQSSVIVETSLTVEQFAKFHAFLSELKGFGVENGVEKAE